MEKEFNDMRDIFKVLPTTQEEKEYMIVIGKHLATTEKFPTREAGIEVITGVLENECNELNKRFFIWQRENRPFVLLKWAQTRDGFIDEYRTTIGKGPVQIYNLLTKQFTHKYRAVQ